MATVKANKVKRLNSRYIFPKFIILNKKHNYKRNTYIKLKRRRRITKFRYRKKNRLVSTFFQYKFR